MRRLLRIREALEEQRRIELESALGELSRLEAALAFTEERNSRGRRLIESSISGDGTTDRLAGAEEMSSAELHAERLEKVIADQREEVDELREELMASRLERRQVETLIEMAQARAAGETARRSRQETDDRFGIERHRRQSSEAHADGKRERRSSLRNES